MRAVAIPSLAVVPPAVWDLLAPPDHPFCDHAFLHGLEVSGCVGPGTSWMPVHLLIVEPDATQPDPGLRDALAGCRLLGAAPLYVRGDSWGEFIFDFGWAQAAQRAGLPYYPKLVSAVPFTPATGPRLLVRPGEDAAAIGVQLALAIPALARDLGAHSAHILFLTGPEADLATAAEGAGWFRRLTAQARWDDQDYGTFDGFLATRRAPIRKQIRRERRLVAESGLRTAMVAGPDMDDLHWQAIRRFYVHHVELHGGNVFLNEKFFLWMREHIPHYVMCSFAYSGDRPIAGTFNLVKGKTMYGRYWGYDEQHPFLHFELAFYALIEHCLATGLTRLEAGAGGAHKLQRGLEGVAIHSVHTIFDARFARAIQQATVRERADITAHLAELKLRGTARRDGHLPAGERAGDG